MVIDRFRNRNGWVKLTYGKRHWLFGKKMFFVKSGGRGRTDICYNTLKEAEGVFKTIKQLLQ